MSLRRKSRLILFTLVAIVFLFGTSSFAGELPAVKNQKKGTVIGRIMIKDGGPLSGGQVLFYRVSAGPPPASEKYDRTPDVVRDMDADGRFRVELQPGKYYFGAVKRLSGERIGNPQEGDYVYRSVDEKGKPKEYVVEEGKILDLGTISEAVPLKAGRLSKNSVTTAIEGVVVDMDGNPVQNAVVVAFLSPTVGGKPIFVSDATGEDGKYLLRVTEGTYYLRVRNQFASGPPEPGQIVGFYGEGSPAPVSVKDGEIKKGIGFKVILFPGRGPLSGTPPAR
ncbi:MAG TPA: carboxypeptidase regulatory-like domain-containing protein [Nitrospiraceae bacterium]|jgi:hypothetical protein|nr:carboxypeptidase regulatory-like domain-containing protein [Nitrospiraceae bacterium]